MRDVLSAAPYNIFITVPSIMVSRVSVMVSVGDSVKKYMSP